MRLLFTLTIFVFLSLGLTLCQVSHFLLMQRDIRGQGLPALSEEGNETRLEGNCALRAPSKAQVAGLKKR